MWEKINPNRLLAGVAGILALGLFLEMQGLPSFGSKESDVMCQNKNPRSQPLTGSQLIKLLNVKQGDSRDNVRRTLKDPYCLLPKEEFRKDTIAAREVYLLASDDFFQFDPKTRLVVLYEGDQYQGYRFWVN